MSLDSVRQQIRQSLLGVDPYHDLPFARPVPRRKADYVIRAFQVQVARARHRNPPLPPWRKRNLGAWRTGRPDIGPSDPCARSSPVILGLTVAWNEGDVIWATVQNLLAQGADEVFVIDNDSDDETGAEALAAGATVSELASSGVFSEEERAACMRRVIDEQTALRGGDVWWVVVDADEFPRGPVGLTIRELVEGLPPWVDVVGSRVIEHFPDAASFYQPRTHPAATIPLGRWHNYPYCSRGHWKHQLFRLRVVGDLYPMGGRQTLGAGDGRRIREAEATLLMHHVPLRGWARTEARLRAGASGRFAECPEKFIRKRLAHRIRLLGYLRDNRFDAAPNEFPGEKATGVSVCHWWELVPASERSLPELGILR